MTADVLAGCGTLAPGWTGASVPGFPAPEAGGLALDLVAGALSAVTSQEAGSRYFEALRPYGIRSLNARAFTPGSGGTWREQLYCRIVPAGGEDSPGSRGPACADPMLREVQRRAGPFTWSGIALPTPAEGGLAGTYSEGGAPDGLAIPCHGPRGYAGVVSLGFADLDGFTPSERRDIAVAALVLHDRMRVLSAAAAPPVPRLTRRERDCMLQILDGKSDREMADLLGLAVPTVVTHIKGARVKLGAKTRAQAVAHFLAACPD